MVEHSIPALEVVLVFITIYLHIYFYFFIESSIKQNHRGIACGITLDSIKVINGQFHIGELTLLKKLILFQQDKTVTTYVKNM